jgi:hypothetical protein
MMVLRSIDISPERLFLSYYMDTPQCLQHIQMVTECMRVTKYLHTEQCLASSKILTPHPLSTQRVCPPPHRAVRGGGGFNILEDARHWIGLLQNNPSTRASIYTR